MEQKANPFNAFQFIVEFPRTADFSNDINLILYYPRKPEV